jgi:hypothetical protein
MQKKIVSLVLGIFLLGMAAQAQSTTIFNSLLDSIIGEGPIGIDPFGPPPMNGDNWRAQSFMTGGANWTSESVTLSLLSGGSSTGGFTVSLYGDSGNGPGAQLGTLTGNGNPGSGLSPFTGAIALNPDATYWIVTDVSSDHSGSVYGWMAGTGGPAVGSTVGAGYSSDGGVTWGVDTTSSYLMQVDATFTAAPEPSTIALGLMGGAGYLLLFRRRE